MKYLLIFVTVGILALVSVSAQAQTSQSKATTPVISAQPAGATQAVSPKPAGVRTLPVKAQHTALAPQPDILAQPSVSSAHTSTAHASMGAHVSAAPRANPQPDMLPHSALGTSQPSTPQRVQAAPAPVKPE